jgi:Uncharacterized protein conserved in bacteria (DUF2064)
VSDCVVAVVLTAPEWTPERTDRQTWRAALAEDVVDVVCGLVGVDPAIVVAPNDRALAAGISWPATRLYEVGLAVGDPFAPELMRAVFAAARADGYERAALVCADVPDLPGLLLGKLLRPLTSRPVVLAPAVGGGLWAVATTLPAPGWLLTGVSAAAKNPAHVSTAPPWHRLRSRADLNRLDPGLEGWEATRALLFAQG